MPIDAVTCSGIYEDLMWMPYKILFSTILMLTLSTTQVHSAVSVAIHNAPAYFSPGQAVTINTQFSKTAGEPEKRVVIRVDLHDSDTNAKVTGGVADNGGAGYTDGNAVVPCTITIPAGASGSYYFKATVAPWSLNRAVLQQYKSYPTDGTFDYLWGNRRGDYGVTQNVAYLGEIICPVYAGNPGDPITTYCSGVAFETAVLALNTYNATYGHPRIGNIQTAANMRSFRLRWYGVTDADKLAARAIPEWGAGREITDFEEAQDGDFIQLWRQPYGANLPSGHNPLFVNWVRDSSSQITGARYWGSQGSTDGIGYNTETFGTGSGRLNVDRFYIGRLSKPRDQADYDWALGQADTQGTPSTVGSSVDDWLYY